MGLVDPTRFRCPACSYDGPPPDAARDGLARARAAVSSLDVRERQLSSLQRRVLGSGLVRSGLYLALFAVVVLPFACCFAGALPGLLEGPLDVASLVCFIAPLLLVTVSGISGFLFLRARLGRLRASLAAFPPPAPGEPAGCHVCGGPVTASEGDTFARCGWCGADNLLDAELVQAQGRSRIASLDEFESEVQRRQRIVHDALRGATRGLLYGALVSLPAACCLSGGVFIALEQTETELHEELRYTLVEAPPGRCVAVLSTIWNGEGTVQLVARGWTGDDDLQGAELTTVRPAGDVPTFGARALVGADVVPMQLTDPQPMRVESVYGNLGRPTNQARLRGPDGSEERQPLETLCLVEGAPAPVPPVPLTVAAAPPAEGAGAP